MMSARDTDPPPFAWGNIGNPAYYAVWGGTLRGVLYWDFEGVGELGGPGGEPVVTTAGWFVIPADQPDHHVQVEARALERGMADGALAAATDEAMGEATRILAERLGLDQ